jgi:hypothetical protein
VLQLNLGSHFGFRRRRVVRARVKTTPTNHETPPHTLEISESTNDDLAAMGPTPVPVGVPGSRSSVTSTSSSPRRAGAFRTRARHRCVAFTRSFTHAHTQVRRRAMRIVSVIARPRVTFRTDGALGSRASSVARRVRRGAGGRRARTRADEAETTIDDACAVVVAVCALRRWRRAWVRVI